MAGGAGCHQLLADPIAQRVHNAHKRGLTFAQQGGIGGQIIIAADNCMGDQALKSLAGDKVMDMGRAIRMAAKLCYQLPHRPIMRNRITDSP